MVNGDTMRRVIDTKEIGYHGFIGLNLRPSFFKRSLKYA